MNLLHVYNTLLVDMFLDMKMNGLHYKNALVGRIRLYVRDINRCIYIIDDKDLPNGKT